MRWTVTDSPVQIINNILSASKCDLVLTVWVLACTVVTCTAFHLTRIDTADLQQQLKAKITCPSLQSPGFESSKPFWLNLSLLQLCYYMSTFLVSRPSSDLITLPFPPTPPPPTKKIFLHKFKEYYHKILKPSVGINFIATEGLNSNAEEGTIITTTINNKTTINNNNNK